jgi:predicted GNAT superfamily acetyltransferase
MDAPRPLAPEDVAPLLALNNEHAQALSWQEPAQFDTLLATAFHTRTVGTPPAALLVAFDETAPYDNQNFNWLKARFPRFVYIDRVVVATSAGGKGYARALYDELREAAKQAGQERLVCEINVEPPNPGSVAFHSKMGFREVGRATLDNGKTVAYFECPL